MSCREKSAWISLMLLRGLFGPYFWLVARALLGAGRVHIGTQFAMVGLFVVLEIVVHIAVAIQSPHEARAPKDEREDFIDLKATRVAFYVLLVGVIVSIFSRHFPVNVWTLSQYVLFSVVVAELAKFASQIVLFRLGA